MIYFDNSATTLIKPPEVSEAVVYAIQHFGNAGRSFYPNAIDANRAIYRARMEIAKLTGAANPLHVAFTSSATESLNLVIGGLIKKEEHVLTTVAEHNSVLRPLYLTGCELTVLDCDNAGNLLLENVEAQIKDNTRYLVCTHGSNLTGNITDVSFLYALCKKHDLIMILDIAQTLGAIETKCSFADVLCFTGHKGLFGPQGTGGIICEKHFPFSLIKSGGAGVDSFAHQQSSEMPDIFEVGTQNSHGIFGLQKGCLFVNDIGISAIHAKEMALATQFVEGIRNIENIILYGDFTKKDRLPIVSLNIANTASEDVALALWETYHIATRAGSHCAPLLHKRFGTEKQGMVRFSFSYFNTENEIDEAIRAIKTIVSSLRV